MQSIGFFVPIIYSCDIKTVSQQILETVDEYFYLGNSSRVTIFVHDTEHLQALQDRHNRHRSWINIGFKVASYCTLVIPAIGLTIKFALRFYLRIPYIHLQSNFFPKAEENVNLDNLLIS